MILFENKRVQISLLSVMLIFLFQVSENAEAAADILPGNTCTDLTEDAKNEAEFTPHISEEKRSGSVYPAHLFYTQTGKRLFAQYSPLSYKSTLEDMTEMLWYFIKQSENNLSEPHKKVYLLIANSRQHLLYLKNIIKKTHNYSNKFDVVRWGGDSDNPSIYIENLLEYLQSTNKPLVILTTPQSLIKGHIKLESEENLMRIGPYLSAVLFHQTRIEIEEKGISLLKNLFLHSNAYFWLNIFPYHSEINKVTLEVDDFLGNQTFWPYIDEIENFEQGSFFRQTSEVIEQIDSAILNGSLLSYSKISFFDLNYTFKLTPEKFIQDEFLPRTHDSIKEHKTGIIKLRTKEEAVVLKKQITKSFPEKKVFIFDTELTNSELSRIQQYFTLGQDIFLISYAKYEPYFDISSSTLLIDAQFSPSLFPFLWRSTHSILDSHRKSTPSAEAIIFWDHSNFKDLEGMHYLLQMMTNKKASIINKKSMAHTEERNLIKYKNLILEKVKFAKFQFSPGVIRTQNRLNAYIQDQIVVGIELKLPPSGHPLYHRILYYLDINNFTAGLIREAQTLVNKIKRNPQVNALSPAKKTQLDFHKFISETQRLKRTPYIPRQTWPDEEKLYYSIRQYRNHPDFIEGLNPVAKELIQEMTTRVRHKFPAKQTALDLNEYVRVLVEDNQPLTLPPTSSALYQRIRWHKDNPEFIDALTPEALELVRKMKTYNKKN